VREVFRFAHVMMQINSAGGKWVALGECDLMGALPSWGSGCFLGTPQSNVASFMSSDLPDRIPLVGPTIESLD